jgi:hypothetical protein
MYFGIWVVGQIGQSFFTQTRKIGEEMRGIECAAFGVVARDPELKTGKTSTPYCAVNVGVTIGEDAETGRAATPEFSDLIPFFGRAREMTTFRDKLTRILFETTKGESLEGGLPSETSAEVVCAIAEQLGKFVALQCGGHRDSVAAFLDMATQQMHEEAADTMKAGQFLANPDNWFVVDSRGVMTEKRARETIKYDRTHWFHQEVARALLRLMMERGTKEIDGEKCLAATYHPEMTAMVMSSLSETLGKAAVLLTDAGKDDALISTLLEGATQNAFSVAAKFKQSIVIIDKGDQGKMADKKGRR